jgi:hypothetical protein
MKMKFGNKPANVTAEMSREELKAIMELIGSTSFNDREKLGVNTIHSHLLHHMYFRIREYLYPKDEVEDG